MRVWLLAVAWGGSAVLEYTDANFDAGRKEHTHLLVFFHAPWCGHCRQLTPDFERAAQYLSTSTPPVSLAKVDATSEAQLAEEYQIRGYPTLKFFTESGKVIDYTGGRTAESIVAWTMKKVGPAAHKLEKQEDIDAFTKQHATCVLAYVEDEGVLETFMVVARESEDIVFGYTMDAGAAAAKGLARPTIQMLFPHDAKSATYSASLSDSEQLHAFIGTYRLPMVVPFDGDVAPILFADTRPILVVFTQEGKGTSEAELALKEAAPDLLGKVLMCTAGSFEPMDQRLMDYVGVDPDGTLPAVRLLVDPNGPLKKYKFEGDISAASLKDFFAKYSAGELSLDLKSQDVPAAQTGPVYEVVGKSFKEVVLDAEKDALLFFYAPWCGHCRKFEPVYVELASKLASVPSLLVAKIDATQNDVEGIDITGFPTVYLYRTGKKDQPLTYEGERDTASMVQWLKDTGCLSAKDEL
jgi:protein disulfide-isomerase A1